MSLFKKKVKKEAAAAAPAVESKSFVIIKNAPASPTRRKT